MKKILLLSFTLSFLAGTTKAQKLFSTKTGHVWFFSSTSVEDIEAHTKQANAVLNIEKGELAFALLIKSFEFEKALMQEHFNENYMESDKYPKATFKGTISNFQDLNLKKDGTYNTNVEGDLTIHGITKKITAEGTIIKKEKTMELKSLIKIMPQDYNIQIPKMVENNIAKIIEVHIETILNSNK